MLLANLGEETAEAHTARFFASFSVLCIFTRNPHFERMFQTLCGVATTNSSLLCAITSVVCLYALAARDIFQDAVDDAGETYFDTYHHSVILTRCCLLDFDLVLQLTTFFRLFVGEGWHGVMFAAADATTQVSRYFFMTFTVLVGLLLSPIFTSMVITMYSEMQQLQSKRIYNFLLGFYANRTSEVPIVP